MSGARHGALGLLLWLSFLAPAARAIIGGSTDAGDPAVALMVNTSSSTLCSGTLIGPQVFLTAAHCVLGDTDASHYQVVGGVEPLSSADWTASVTGVASNPDFDLATGAHSEGVLLLASVPPVAHLPWLASDPGGIYAPGVPFTAVGYGVTDPNQPATAGVKRSVDLALGTIDPTTFLSDSTGGKGPCEGDSGGPALAMVNQTETLIGVISQGDPACGQYALYARTDADAAFISTYAPEPGGAVGSALAAAVLTLLARSRSETGPQARPGPATPMRRLPTP